MGRRASQPRKVQSQLMVNRTVRDRADALALVVPDTRAEVYRRALEIGLVQLEGIYSGQLRSQLDPHATRLGLDRAELAGLMAERDLSLTEVAKMDAFPVDITTP